MACVGSLSIARLDRAMNPKVDDYIERSQKWPELIEALRPILLAAGMREELKWRKPCYTHNGKNIAIVQEFNHALSLMFFKGALLSDPDGMLIDQGPHSRSAKRMEFTSVSDVQRLADTVTAYVAEAIDVEEAGLVVEAVPELVMVDELQDRLDQDPELKAAFEALTPGRQREYNLYFAGAKQSATRTARVDRYADKIKDGTGLRDR